MTNKSSHMKIGQRIKEEVQRQGLSAKKFGELINCERANVYKIYDRTTIDTALLGIISNALNHNFFLDIVNEPTLSGVENENALKEIRNRMAVSQFVEVIPKILLKLGIEPVIFFGRPIELPEEIPVPDYYISPFNITLSVGDLLFDKYNCNLDNAAKVKRITDETTGLQIDQWEFLFPEPHNMINLKLDFKTDDEWEYTLRFVFKHFFNQYKIIQE